MSWFVLAVLSIIAASIANILNKILMDEGKSDAMLSSIIFQLTLTFFFVIIAIFKGFVMPPIWQYPLNFALAGFFYGMGTYCIFKALKYIESSEATIISSSVVLITIASAFIFLHERLTLTNIIGVILIVIAVIGVSLKNRAGKKDLDKKGIYYALGMALFYGLGATNDAFLINRVDTISYLIIISFLPGLFLTIISPKSLLKISYYVKPRNAFNMIVFSFFYVVSAISFYLALRQGAQVSQLSSITRASVVLTVILAAIFLKENDRFWQKIFFGCLVLIGVFLVK